MDAPRPITSRHHGLLGTVVELRTWAATPDEASAAARLAIAEVERLQAVFDVFDPTSELERWKAEGHEPSPELGTVLGLARRWAHRSGGAFDPAIGRLVAIWDRAAADGVVPADAVLAAAVGDHGDEATLRRWCNLNAIAKGWIAERAADAALAAGIEGITVNAGGDLVHRHAVPLVVGIEDPARPHDNVPPRIRVELSGGALATSGGARRGWSIGGRWFGHVLDPRTGRPAAGVASASVLAPDAATADVVATILTVLGVDEGLLFVDRLPEVGCCVITAEGEVVSDPFWQARQLSAR